MKKLVLAVTSLLAMSTVFTGCSSASKSESVTQVETSIETASIEASESVQTETSTEEASTEIETEKETKTEAVADISTETATVVESEIMAETEAITVPEEFTAENILQYNSDLLAASTYKDVKLSVYSNGIALTSYHFKEDTDTKYHAWALASVVMEEYTEGSEAVSRSIVSGSNAEIDWVAGSNKVDTSIVVDVLKSFLENGEAAETLSEDGTLTVTVDGNTVLKGLGEWLVESKSISECVAVFDKESGLVQKVTFSVSGDKCVESIVLEVGGLNNTESISMP